MSINEKTIFEQIKIAITSDNIKILRKLCDSADMNVRRALAKNKNIDEFIGNKLLYDPVLNVSYLASLNPNTTQKRVFDEKTLTQCVKCDVDELKLDCANCPHSK
ncbi:hypothetical protein ACMC56_00065 [Campylobacterota bacterium DY0563]